MRCYRSSLVFNCCC